ncbi:hypothetical protein ACF0H5_022792 [Mactra antiquata]
MKDILILSLLGVLLMVHETSGMYGLCSTNWFTNDCDDLGDECARADAQCYHPGVGDHNDGCILSTKCRHGNLSVDFLASKLS